VAVSVIEGVRVALRSLAANKLRSALTMLGMIIGVGAVIALVAAVAGSQAVVAERFESLGSNLLTISPGVTFLRGLGMGQGGAVTQSFATQSLSSDDAEAIRNLSTSVVLVAPEYSTQAQITYLTNTTQVSVVGVTPEYAMAREWSTERGRFIESLGDTTRAKVVVLGATAAEDLFGDTLVDPLGKMVKINRVNYQVVGIMTSMGAMQNLDNSVFIPLSTAQTAFGGAGNRSLTAITVKIISEDRIDFAKAELMAILRASRGLSGSQANGFTIQDQTRILEMVAETAQTLSVLLGSIASISLVVGGIGIMSIMLVSVTERTREIGIRKAVGARRRDILTQFLVEAVVLSLAGGITGVLLGYGGAQVITPMLGGTRAVVTLESVVMALSVSIAVGLFFGIYPASRAAGLHPIEALRYE